jgi:hypothetical protein
MQSVFPSIEPGAFPSKNDNFSYVLVNEPKAKKGCLIPEAA